MADENEKLTTAPLFAADGTRTGDAALPAALFGAPRQGAAVSQAVLAALANARLGTASTRNRSAVAGGGAKPWRQKGTGRARQGSIRAPHWRHGGVVFGPNGRRYAQRVPKKVRRTALAAALSSAAAEGRVAVIEALRIEGGRPRAKDGQALLAKLGASGDTLIVAAAWDRAVASAFRNLSGAVLRTPRSLKLTDVLVADRLLFERASLDDLAEVRT